MERPCALVRAMDMGAVVEHGPRFTGTERWIYTATPEPHVLPRFCIKIAAPNAQSPYDASTAREEMERLNALLCGKHGYMVDDIGIRGVRVYRPYCSEHCLGYRLESGSRISAPLDEDTAARLVVGFFRFAMLWGAVLGGHGRACGSLDRGALLSNEDGTYTVLAPPRTLGLRSRARRILCRVHCAQGDASVVKAIGEEERATVEVELMNRLCAPFWHGTELPTTNDILELVGNANESGRDPDEELRGSIDAITGLLTLLAELRVTKVQVREAMMNMRPWDIERE